MFIFHSGFSRVILCFIFYFNWATTVCEACPHPMKSCINSWCLQIWLKLKKLILFLFSFVNSPPPPQKKYNILNSVVFIWTFCCRKLPQQLPTARGGMAWSRWMADPWRWWSLLRSSTRWVLTREVNMSDVSGRYLILCTSNDVTVERESSFFRQLMLDIVHMGLI